jgi:hypothetical protein
MVKCLAGDTNETSSKRRYISCNLLSIRNGGSVINSPLIAYTGELNGQEGTSISLSAQYNLQGNVYYSVSNGTGMAYVKGSTLNLIKAGTVRLSIMIVDSLDQILAGINKVITIKAAQVKVVKEEKEGVIATVYGSGVRTGDQKEFNLHLEYSDNNQIKVNLIGSGSTTGTLSLYNSKGILVSVLADGFLKGSNEFKISLKELETGSYILKLETIENSISKSFIINYAN